jgi:hypothetical protein
LKIFNLANIFEQLVAPAEVQPSVYFSFFGKKFKKSYSLKGGTDKWDATSQEVVYSNSKYLCTYLAHISGDTVPLKPILNKNFEFLFVWV